MKVIVVVLSRRGDVNLVLETSDHRRERRLVAPERAPKNGATPPFWTWFIENPPLTASSGANA
jgi:hypothetical protein